MSDDQNETLEIPSGHDALREANKGIWNNIRWRVLFCVLEKHGDKSITELARLAKMTVEDTVIALESYELLGYIKKTPQGYTQITNSILRVPNTESLKVEVLQDYLFPNMQVINEMLQNPKDENHFSKSLVYNSNSKYFNELKEKITAAVTEFKEKSNSSCPSTWDGVYTLSAVMTQLSKLD